MRAHGSPDDFDFKFSRGGTHQHPAVLVFHPLEQLEDRVHDVEAKHRQLWIEIALPSAHLEEDELAEDGKGAVVVGVRHNSPLVVVQVSASILHPLLRSRPSQLLAKSTNLHELVVILDHRLETLQGLQGVRLALLAGDGDDHLAVGRELEREPGQLVCILRSRQLVDRVKKDEERTICVGKVEQLLEEGGDGNRVVRDVLEGEEERVGELLTDGSEKIVRVSVWFKYLRSGPREVELGVVPQNLTKRSGWDPGSQRFTALYAVMLSIEDFPDPPAPYITNGL